MAYNTLTGTVNFSNAVRGAIESMVDDYSTQAIGGTKSFTSTLSASAFRSEAGDIVPPALTAIAGDSSGRLIVSDGDGTATCDATLTFSSTSLTASYFSGSARGLTALPIGGANVAGELSASNIYYGNGLTSSSDRLLVTGGAGIVVDGTGVAIDMATNGGLAITAEKLRVDPADGTAKASLSDNDKFLISDSDASDVLKSSTLTVLQTYMQNGLTFTTPGGSDNTVQTKSGASFAGSSNLTFDGTTLTLAGGLTASVNISASAFYGDATRLSYPGNTSEVAFYSDGLMAGDGGWLFVTGAGGSETHTIVVDTQFSSSQNLSASVFYGDGSKLTGISAGASTGSGGEGEIQFMRSNDGAFASDGAFSFKTGSSGAAGTSLTCSNLVVTHGVKLPYAVKTANYTLLVSDNVIYMSGNANNLTASLPAAATVDGTVYYIKNISKHRETEIDPNGSELIEYTASVHIGEGEGVRIQALQISGGIYSWQIIGTAMPLP